MRLQRGLIFALGASVVAGACASAGTTAGASAAPGGAVAGAFPTVTCPAGVSVTPSAAAQTAAKSLLLNRTQDAVTGAQAAVTAEEANPQHQYLLGRAQAAAGNVEGAVAAWNRAVQLCPAFSSEIAADRDRLWATAFQAGMDAYQKNDTAAAVAAWQRANMVSSARPDATFNLGVVYWQRGDIPRATQAYRQTLEILGKLPADTSAAEMAQRAEMRQNAYSGLLGAGARSFQSEQYDTAASIFRYITTADPNNRDAWYNYALAMYKMQRWTDLIPVAQRVATIDPLNQNAQIILFNAFKESKQNEQALKVLTNVDALPVYVDEVRIETPESGPGRLTGKVTGNKAAAGAPVNLTFTFWGPSGNVGTQSVTVNAPAKGASANFQVPLPQGATVSSFSYTYR